MNSAQQIHTPAARTTATSCPLSRRVSAWPIPAAKARCAAPRVSPSTVQGHGEDRHTHDDHEKHDQRAEPAQDAAARGAALVFSSHSFPAGHADLQLGGVGAGLGDRDAEDRGGLGDADLYLHRGGAGHVSPTIRWPRLWRGRPGLRTLPAGPLFRRTPAPVRWRSSRPAPPPRSTCLPCSPHRCWSPRRRGSPSGSRRAGRCNTSIRRPSPGRRPGSLVRRPVTVGRCGPAHAHLLNPSVTAHLRPPR